MYKARKCCPLNHVCLVAGNFLVACQSPPKSSAELKKVMETSSMGQVEHFAIEKGDLAAVRARLNEFAERCLSKEKYSVRCGLQCTSSIFATYRPSYEPRKEGLRFVLRRKDENGLNVYNLPKEGMFVMVAEAETINGKTAGHVWGAKLGYGDITGSTRKWMTGEDKKCPDLP